MYQMNIRYSFLFLFIVMIFTFSNFHIFIAMFFFHTFLFCHINYFLFLGVSSGGDFSDTDTGNSCKPYAFQSCAHHVSPPPGVVACDTLPEFHTPACTTTCDDRTYNVKYKTDKHHVKSSYGIMGMQNMQRELMEKGSMTVAFTVYEDFELYKTGVYQHVKGKGKITK